MAEPKLASPNDAIARIAAILQGASAGPPAVVLIDGRSGAGKSTLASLILEVVPEARIIRLDNIYPGWHGLEAARDHLREKVLEPLARGQAARWQRWDWAARAPAEWVTVDPVAPLIVEGVGALSAQTRALARFAVWVDLDTALRKERALSRDGDGFAPHWDQWARDEYTFIERERPREHADMIIDGRNIAG